MPGPTIRERLDYLDVCNVAIEYYSKNMINSMQNSRSAKTWEEKEKMDANSEEYSNLQQKFKAIKKMIIEDLTKDPDFLKYTSNLVSESTNLQEPEQQISEEKTSPIQM